MAGSVTPPIVLAQPRGASSNLRAQEARSCSHGPIDCARDRETNGNPSWRSARDGPARPSRRAHRRARRPRSRRLIPTGAAPRSPRSSRARRGSSTAGPGSVSSPATRSRGTPASGSATTVVSTSSAKPVGAGSGYVRCEHETNRGFLRSLDGLRSHRGGDRRDGRGAALRRVPDAARSDRSLAQAGSNLEWLE